MSGDPGVLVSVVKRAFIVGAVLAAVGVGALLWWNIDAPARLGPPSASSGASNLITLDCADSAGQQARDGEKVVGGVEGLVLPGSGEPSALSPLRGVDGRRYFVYKAFLAVSSNAAPYATVSIVSPRGARLYYGSAGEVGRLSSSHDGRALVAASRTHVRLQVCGAGFTGYVGGVIVEKPTMVTFAVSSPHRATERVSIPVGTD